MITMEMFGRVRRMFYRDGISRSEIARRTGLSRTTVQKWIKAPAGTEPKYQRLSKPGKLSEFKDELVRALKADARRPRRDRRTALMLFHAIKAKGYSGGYTAVTDFIRAWHASSGHAVTRAFVPLQFESGDAHQFDWSEEHLVVGGVWRKIMAAHLKLCFSRAFVVQAYPTQSHEMLFDAHARAFAAFNGIPRRGIYDNMKTAVDRVGRGKERDVNPRFFAMCGHYLFDPEFCNRAAGWEKGIVEKNVQDRRRQIWQAAGERRWANLEELNAWVGQECRAAWAAMAHPEWPELTIADLLQDEQLQMMPNPRPFDGYVEKPIRVSSTALIHFQRNRYSVPSDYAHRVISLRIYSAELRLVADGVEVARHERSFERHQTFYDFRHYIGVIERKPGALRNGAPFADMPEPLLVLQRHLLKQTGGDRVMADVLAAIPRHGLDGVVVAAELALESGRPSGEHVLNVLARLKGPAITPPAIQTPLSVSEEPVANVHRYDHLRMEAGDVR